MTEPPQQVLTVREMALAKWIEDLVGRKFGDDDRVAYVGLCTAAMVLVAADKDGNLPEVDERTTRAFTLTIRDGCEKRGAKRAETAVACQAVAFAFAKRAAGEV